MKINDEKWKRMNFNDGDFENLNFGQLIHFSRYSILSFMKWYLNQTKVRPFFSSDLEYLGIKKSQMKKKGKIIKNKKNNALNKIIYFMWLYTCILRKSYILVSIKEIF